MAEDPNDLSQAAVMARLRERVTFLRAVLTIYASNEAYSKHVGHDATIDYVPAAEALATLDDESQAESEVERLKAAMKTAEDMLRNDPFILVNAANYLSQERDRTK